MLILLLPLRTMAQEGELVILRGDCTPDISGNTTDSHRASRRLPACNTDWDADKIYKQLVILFSFSDNDFQEEHSLDFYNSILNKPGYNEGKGAGCVTDYFRTQSGGLFNLEFDIYGPYKVSQKAQPYDEPTSSTKNYGHDAMHEATQQFVSEHPEIDFSQYDWNGNGYVNQVVFIYAGYGSSYMLAMAETQSQLMAISGLIPVHSQQLKLLMERLYQAIQPVRSYGLRQHLAPVGLALSVMSSRIVWDSRIFIRQPQIKAILSVMSGT